MRSTCRLLQTGKERIGKPQSRKSRPHLLSLAHSTYIFCAQVSQQAYDTSSLVVSSVCEQSDVYKPTHLGISNIMHNHRTPSLCFYTLFSTFTTPFNRASLQLAGSLLLRTLRPTLLSLFILPLCARSRVIRPSTEVFKVVDDFELHLLDLLRSLSGLELHWFRRR